MGEHASKPNYEEATVKYRGSGTDLATDLRAIVPRAKLQDMVDSLLATGHVQGMTPNIMLSKLIQTAHRQNDMLDRIAAALERATSGAGNQATSVPSGLASGAAIDTSGRIRRACELLFDAIGQHHRGAANERVRAAIDLLEPAIVYEHPGGKSQSLETAMPNPSAVRDVTEAAMRTAADERARDSNAVLPVDGASPAQSAERRVLESLQGDRDAVVAAAERISGATREKMADAIREQCDRVAAAAKLERERDEEHAERRMTLAERLLVLARESVDFSNHERALAYVNAYATLMGAR